jgi:hypothetical protein
MEHITIFKDFRNIKAHVQLTLETLNDYLNSLKLWSWEFWDWNKFCESTLVLKSFLMLRKRFAICNKTENVGERKGGRGRCKKNIVYGLFPFSIRLHIYTPSNKVVGGYTDFTMSVCRQIPCRSITWVVLLRIF